MSLSAADLLRAFDSLSAELARRGEHAQFVVAGGAALVLLFEARETTNAVDAYVVRPEASVLRDAINRVASQLDLPPDWLNDNAKDYFLGISLGAPLYESPNLLVRAATTVQLLAMKLAAWRDAIDRGDAQLLLTEMEGSKAEIWTTVKRFIAPHDLQKASYAFEDLWEAVHGTS